MATVGGKAPVPQRARIGVRIRPLLQDEEGAKHDKHAWTWRNRTISQQIFPAHLASSSTEAAAFDRRMKDSPTSYTFDRLFPPDTSTAVVYASVAKDAVMDAMRGGHNGLVVAYGQSNSGKTYSIQGKGGIIGLALRDIFHHVQEQRHMTEYVIRVAFVDIESNEVIHDLLTPSMSRGATLVQGAGGEFELTGHTEESVMSLGHALAILDAGVAKQGRLASSQRHTVLRVTVESQAKTTTSSTSPIQPTDSLDSVHVAVLHFVDLAASESVNRVVQGRDEGSAGLNKSLLAFGHLIWKLSHEAKNHHHTDGRLDLPYGDSQLTRLVQPSLGPHASLAMLCTMSPSLSCLNETHKTLKFASRAKRIHYTLWPQQAGSVDDDARPSFGVARSSVSTSVTTMGTIRLKMAVLHDQLHRTVDDDGRDNIRVALHNLHRVLLNSDEVEIVSNVSSSPPSSAKGSTEDGVARQSATSSHRSTLSFAPPTRHDHVLDTLDAPPTTEDDSSLDDNAAVHAATLDLLRRKIDSLGLKPDDASVLLHGLLVLERAYHNAASTT